MNTKNILVRTIDNMSPLVVNHEDMAHVQTAAASTSSNSSISRQEPSSSLVVVGPAPFSFCAHPIHLHSLIRLVNLSTILKSRFQSCFVCQERISLVAAKEIVTCVACGVFSHRSCLLPIVVAEEEDEYHSWSIKHKNQIKQNCDNRGGGDNDDGDYNYTNRHGRIVEKCKVNLQLSKDRCHYLQTYMIASATTSNLKDCESTSSIDSGGDLWHEKHDDEDLVEEATVVANNVGSSGDNHDNQGGNGVKQQDNSHVECANNDQDDRSPKFFTTQEQQREWKQSLAKLSRLLHIHNIFSSQGQSDASNGMSDISSPQQGQNVVCEGNMNAMMSSVSEQQQKDATTIDSKIIMQRISRNLQSNMHDIVETSCATVDTEEDISATILDVSHNSIMKENSTREGSFMKGTWQVLQKTNNTRKSLGVASIAGSIAGATAGLIVAGPAGAYVGSKIGQVVGVAGVLIEGTVSVGVLFAGVTGTVFTVKQLQNEEKRLLTIGGKGSEQVVLVRPNVTVDPIWNDITTRVRRSYPKDSGGLMDGFPFFGDKVGEATKKERERRDREIAFSKEDEINTKEKVFLLVASSLNDKRCLPGYVYRELIYEVKRRVEGRKQHTRNNLPLKGRTVQDITRETRQDVHGIIKHITATLLEVRPGFSSSPRITELSAMAVETLVFGEIYDDVFDEICDETRQQDINLETKFSSLESEAKTKDVDLQKHISQEAIISIRRLPFYHSVGDKLRCCVELLEFVSQSGTNHNMGADFLLTLVCQHLAVAAIPHLNAECAFLEEFAKDEQLLQGKEGYALVTIQASIHFLNASDDIIQDVFLVQD